MGYCLSKAKLSQGFSVAKHHCLANNNAQINLFVWGPTEPVATRPLFMLANPGGYKFFYICDGNKNVSELVHFETRNGIAAHYDYAPFGAVTRAISASTIADNTFTTDNPFRFSSEYHDDTLGLVYYNYRHYNPTAGRWTSRDPAEEKVSKNLYQNKGTLNGIDVFGLAYFALRPLEGISEFGVFWDNAVMDYLNLEVAHEQLFFEDAKIPNNIGFFNDNNVRSDTSSLNYKITRRGFNDCVMRVAVENVKPQEYSLLGGMGTAKYNCQTYAEELREMYYYLQHDPCIRCRCDLE